MANSSLKRDGAPLTDNEKSIIINVYNYFSGARSIGMDHQSLPLRKHVAEVLGIVESTVRKVVTDWNKHDDGTFTSHEVLGRPKSQPDENISELLRTKILNSNKTAKKTLRALGYYYGQGEQRNILHESPNNVAFRCRYLHFRFANLEGNNNVPCCPEVFLDESYCHLHYISRNTWVPHQGVVLTPGHGPLVVIFGAIIVFQNGSSNKLHDELVPNSVHIWDPTIKPPGNRGRKRNDAEEWSDIPDVIKGANIIPNQIDYHRNFNAEIFENLFTTLCETIYEKYGLVNIHMDGARYHKRRVESIPTSSTKKQEIIDWLIAYDIEFSDELQRPELLELVQMNKKKVPFACVKIAERNTLLNTFKEKIDSKVIIGLWRRALKYAKEYCETDKYAQLIEEDFDDYDDSDDDE
ncbi:hypothetical protein H257_11777 [Rhizophagus clarus]|uniref:Tc1-like transposase DDE domain-containing protein n=1 Tax=Rhizophagus clarus TaxID=94130 RepID=A0A8H3LAW5_9GLOM|nr:hypothetical protein H257_11777 [Rhizophagus clarus]